MNVRCACWTGCIRACGWTGWNGWGASTNSQSWTWWNGWNGANGWQVIYAYMHWTPETICVNGWAWWCWGCWNGWTDWTPWTSWTDGWKVVYTVWNDPTIQNFHLEQDADNEAINVTWWDPSFLPISPVQWWKTVVRYSTVNYPTTPTDGTLLVEETVKNTYETNPFVLSGVLDGTTYYFSAFALDSNDNIIDTVTNSVTTDFGWHVTPNTLCYRPLENDSSELAGKFNFTMTEYGISYTTVAWIKSAHVWTTWWINVSPAWLIDHSYSECTISIMANLPSSTTWNTNRWMLEWRVSWKCMVWWVFTRQNHPSHPWIEFWDLWWWWNPTAWKWHHIVYTANSSTEKLYIDWVLHKSWSNPTWYARGNISDSSIQYLLCSRDWPNDGTSMNWNAREIIFEKKMWSDSDVSAYYQWIKRKFNIT